jgi:flagellar export protein FliJ
VKRYAFSLDRVLKVRSAQESVKRQALRAAASRANQAEADHEYAERSYQASLASEAATRGSVLAMLAMRDLDTMRARAVIDAEGHRDDANLSLEEARGEWVSAKQRVSALEQLNERQRADYDRESLAEQDAEADDIVTGRAGRADNRRPGQLRVMQPRDGRAS